MILDATAGNRSIWIEKKSETTIFIDRETELARPPDVICDLREQPFRDRIFNTIFFDPPHEARSNPRPFMNDPKHTWYGLNVSRNYILSLIHLGQKEFRRVLKQDGIVLFKWNDYDIPLGNLKVFWRDWKELMQIKQQMPPKNTSQTFWLIYGMM